ncbi:MAG: hypothetical protein Q4C33_04510 [bacterium]|nr:hypothetical protein [bacterium]
MDINYAFNKICLYSTILGYGKKSNAGSLIQCDNVNLYSSVNESIKGNSRLLCLSVKIVQGDKVVGLYNSEYMFPKGYASIFSGLRGSKLNEFIDVMLSTATCKASFSACEECSFGMVNNIVNFGSKLGTVDDRTKLIAK